MKTHCPSEITNVKTGVPIEIFSLEKDADGNPELKVTCASFNRGICNVLGKACPINANPNGWVEKTSTFFSLNKQPVLEGTKYIGLPQFLEAILKGISVSSTNACVVQEQEPFFQKLLTATAESGLQINIPESPLTRAKRLQIEREERENQMKDFVMLFRGSPVVALLEDSKKDKTQTWEAVDRFFNAPTWLVSVERENLVREKIEQASVCLVHMAEQEGKMDLTVEFEKNKKLFEEAIEWLEKTLSDKEEALMQGG